MPTLRLIVIGSLLLMLTLGLLALVVALIYLRGEINGELRLLRWARGDAKERDRVEAQVDAALHVSTQVGPSDAVHSPAEVGVQGTSKRAPDPERSRMRPPIR
jgi:hypothetical protein